MTGLDHVNFIAGRNARIAVIGANGAGKSTLFKHFNGILRPTSGTVLVHGEPITQKNIREVRKFVGLVFQTADDQIFTLAGSPNPLTLRCDHANCPGRSGSVQSTEANTAGRTQDRWNAGVPALSEATGGRFHSTIGRTYERPESSLIPNPGNESHSR